jgi:anthranilate/para-aminobenzoate synthase component I
VLLRATRPADLETPIGAFLRLDDGTTPAYLLESVEGGERLGRYSFLGVGPRRLLEVRDGSARVQTRPVGVRDYAPDLPVDTAAAAVPVSTSHRVSVPAHDGYSSRSSPVSVMWPGV